MAGTVFVVVLERCFRFERWADGFGDRGGREDTADGATYAGGGGGGTTCAGGGGGAGCGRVPVVGGGSGFGTVVVAPAAG